MVHSMTAKTHHRWELNYADDCTNVSQPPQPSRTALMRTTIETNSIPPGFPPDISARDPSALRTKFQPRSIPAQKDNTGSQDIRSAAYSASWTAAFSPVRTLLTSAFALFMTGTSVQFFSVASTVTVLFMHLQAVFSAREAFKPARRAGLPFINILPQILVHVLLGAFGVAMGLYKAHEMGFLPTTQSDWIALLPLRIVEDGFLRGVAKLPSDAVKS